MKITYHHATDSLYITLTEKPRASGKIINPSFMLDLDAEGKVIGVEILDARLNGIEPLALLVEQLTDSYGGVELSPEQQEERRRLIAEHHSTRSEVQGAD